MDNSRSESKTIFRQLSTYFIIAFMVGFITAKTDPVDYTCASNDTTHDDCYADCNFDKRACLELCGCSKITQTAINPVREGFAFGIVGIIIWALIFSYKTDNSA